LKNVGIIAEYNPFHRGHAYQCNLLREMGYDGIVAVMSGNFVQRADVALTDKYRRAEGAVRSGADLVLELPLPYAVASAEDFARGGVGILAATGAVEAICFGCESGADGNRAQYEALCRAEETGKIGEKIKTGLSYPAACKAAVTESGAPWSDGPNDVLALAYRKALRELCPEMEIIAIERKGSYHGSGEEGYESAESIRRRLKLGEDVSDALPSGSLQALRNAPVADLARMERAILAHYRRSEASDLQKCYGMRDGLAERILRFAGAPDLKTLCDKVKTKRFPYSAVRRAVLCGFLNLPKEISPLSYLRVLAFNEQGQQILKELKTSATLPILTSLPAVKNADPMMKLQLSGDEIFAMTLDPAGPMKWDCIAPVRKIEKNGP